MAFPPWIPGVFAQDNWKFTPRLTFELGLRWDYEALPPADPKLTTATGTFTPYTLADQQSERQNELRTAHRILV